MLADGVNQKVSVGVGGDPDQGHRRGTCGPREGDCNERVVARSLGHMDALDVDDLNDGVCVVEGADCQP
jgi:hypothetical protein